MTAPKTPFIFIFLNKNLNYDFYTKHFFNYSLKNVDKNCRF